MPETPSTSSRSTSIVTALGAHLGAESFAEQARVAPNAFVGERRLPLPRLVAFLVNAPRAGLQSELDAFFDHAPGSTEARPVSKSALCLAGRQLRPVALRELMAHSTRIFAVHSQVPQWHGRRVLALDGSTLRVPDAPECAEIFGGMNTSCGRFRPLAPAFAAPGARSPGSPAAGATTRWPIWARQARPCACACCE